MISPRCLLTLLLTYQIARNCNCQKVLESSFSASENSTKSISSEGGTTTEIHHTTCKITTEQLVADAQATFTRVFTGACNSKIIEDRFEKLEHSFNQRLNEIRDLLASSLRKNDFDHSRIGVKKNLENENLLARNHIDNEDDEFFHKDQKDTLSSRQDEIQRWNNTMHDDEGGREVYTYYWKVSNLYEKLLDWDTGRSERSSSFYVDDAGYAMYLRFTPKYFPDGTIFISAGLTSGRNDSKIMWPFPLQIRIEILDLATTPAPTTKSRPKDRSSRLWDPATVCSSYFWGRPRAKTVGKTGESSDNPECVGLSIPRQLLSTFVVKQTASSPSSATLMTGNYVSNDTVLVKLTVFL